MDQSYSVSCGDNGCSVEPARNKRGRILSTFDPVYTIPIVTKQEQPIVSKREEKKVQKGRGKVSTRKSKKKQVTTRCRKPKPKRVVKKKQNGKRKKC